MTNDNNNLTPSLRIDVKNSRIHIHNHTLKKIGNPSFVCLGYQPETKKLLILAVSSTERGALRVRFDSHGACYIHSKGMINGIREVSGLLTEEKSYILKGVFTHNMSAIAFPIENAVSSTEDKE